MPHAVVEGPVDLETYARNFEPLRVRRGDDVLRAEKLYVETRGRALLIEALVIEAGRKLPFYVRLSAHDLSVHGGGSVTVRIDPRTHPERSPGVHALVAEVVQDLLRRFPDARIGATNLVLPCP